MFKEVNILYFRVFSKYEHLWFYWWVQGYKELSRVDKARLKVKLQRSE